MKKGIGMLMKRFGLASVIAIVLGMVLIGLAGPAPGLALGWPEDPTHDEIVVRTLPAPPEMPTIGPVSPSDPTSSTSEVIIDDLDSGFGLYGPSGGWHHSGSGDTTYNGHAYWTYCTDTWEGSSVNNWATWTPNLPVSGQWEVFAYIPYVITGRPDTGRARYQIHTASGDYVVERNQNDNTGWVSLGTYTFNAGTSGYVRLEDVTPDWYFIYGGQRYRKTIKFDAMKWVSTDSGGQEIKLRGTALEFIQYISASAWRVRVEEVIFGPSISGEIEVFVSYPAIGCTKGYVDPNIDAGDKVEVYGLAQSSEGYWTVEMCWSDDYYIVKISDTSCPSITDISESDDPINKEGCPDPTEVTISADITDPSGVDWVKLCYRLNYGSWTCVDMSLPVFSPPAAGSASYYYATIGPFSDDGTVYYYIRARDNVGNECDSSTYTVTVRDCEQCESGWDVSNVRLNGDGTNITVNLGDQVRIQFDYRIWNGDNCPACIQQLVVGLNDDPLNCAYDGIPNTCESNATTGSYDHTTSPLEPGTYDVIVANDFQYSCGDAMSNYPDLPRETIGTIVVGPQGCPPDLSVFDPEIDGCTVIINGVVTSPCNDPVQRINWDWGDGTSNDSWFAATHTYAESGTYVVTVTAYTAAGYTATETKTVTITNCGDTTPPNISNIRESADPINKQGCPSPTTVTIRADVTDASGLAWVRLYYQPPGGSWTYVTMSHESGSTYKATIGPFSQAGTLYYYVKARDNAGNEAQSSTRTVTVNDCDPTPPSISNIRESNDPINKQGCPSPTTVTIRADVSDASGLAWVRLYYQPPGGSWTYAAMSHESGNTYKATIGPFSQAGTLNYYVKARDNADNEAQSSTHAVTVNDCDCTGDGIYLYEHSNYSGRCHKVTENDTDFGDDNFNDIISSIKFAGSYAGTYAATLYEHAWYQGVSSIFAGDDPDLVHFHRIDLNMLQAA